MNLLESKVPKPQGADARYTGIGEINDLSHQDSVSGSPMGESKLESGARLGIPVGAFGSQYGQRLRLTRLLAEVKEQMSKLSELITQAKNRHMDFHGLSQDLHISGIDEVALCEVNFAIAQRRKMLPKGWMDQLEAYLGPLRILIAYIITAGEWNDPHGSDGLCSIRTGEETLATVNVELRHLVNRLPRMKGTNARECPKSRNRARTKNRSKNRCTSEPASEVTRRPRTMPFALADRRERSVLSS